MSRTDAKVQIATAPRATIDSLHILKYHILVFKAFGLWPNEPLTLKSRLHTIIAFYVLAVGFVVTLGIGIFYVHTARQVIDNLIISTSVIMALFKGAVIHINKPKFLRLFELLKKLDDTVTPKNEQAYMWAVFKQSQLLFRMFLAAYGAAWVALALQIVWSPRHKIFWSSTARYPIGISQYQLLFWMVHVFQAFANFCLCITSAACDTFGVTLNHVLGGHVEVLGLRLRQLGCEEENEREKVYPNGRKGPIELKLIGCLRTYIRCIR